MPPPTPPTPPIPPTPADPTPPDPTPPEPTPPESTLPESPPPESTPPEPPVAAQGLKFGGLMMTIGGALAILRTGERSMLFAVMMPLGLVLWGVGFWMQLKAQKKP